MKRWRDLESSDKAIVWILSIFLFVILVTWGYGPCGSSQPTGSSGQASCPRTKHEINAYCVKRQFVAEGESYEECAVRCGFMDAPIDWRLRR